MICFPALATHFRRHKERVTPRSLWQCHFEGDKNIFFSQAPAAGTVLGGGIKDDPTAMARARAAANNAVQQGFMQPSIDVSNMDEKTQQIYLLKMTIQEVSLKLNQPNLGKLLASPSGENPITSSIVCFEKIHPSTCFF